MRTHPLIVGVLAREHAANLRREAQRAQLTDAARSRVTPPKVRASRGKRRTIFRRFRLTTAWSSVRVAASQSSG